ncbi:MAG: ABC transporter permease subunit [Gammaproteobacteria bacterium]|jgi:NitT/TauT family transport system permease protein|nr:ABC transporter permease subunit [Gammaproteobacteria bacterium]
MASRAIAGAPTARLLRRSGAALAYLWSGWGAVASLFLFLALWDLGNRIYGSFILPSPQEAFAALGDLIARGAAQQQLGVTLYRAAAGFAVAVGFGTLLGIVAGLSMTAAMAARPLVTVLLGVPPIAWIVLALLWFGASDGTPIFTVAITTVPITFAAAMQGARTLDGDLRTMARAFRAPLLLRFTDVYLPHILSYVFPGWITALGMSWKVVVMAELLSTPDGVGAGLAAARINLDTAQTLAWILAVVGTLLAAEYLLLEPIKRHLERWRHDTP